MGGDPAPDRHRQAEGSDSLGPVPPAQFLLEAARPLSGSGDFTRRFDEEAIVDLMEAINSTRQKVSKEQPRGFLCQAFIDTDGTIAPTFATRLFWELGEVILAGITGKFYCVPILLHLYPNTQTCANIQERTPCTKALRVSCRET